MIAFLYYFIIEYSASITFLISYLDWVLLLPDSEFVTLDCPYLRGELIMIPQASYRGISW